MRRHRSLLVAVVVVIAVLAAAPAYGADKVVGQLLRPSTIRAYDGIQVFSEFDGSAYRLAVRREGRIERLPVARSLAPFDVDVGPDRNGRPQLVYTRCKVERPDVEFGTNTSTGCDLVVFSLAGRGGERPVRNANTTQSDEFSPTLWKGRVAFARRARDSDRARVYIRQLAAPRSQPSERLPGAPGHTTSRGVLSSTCAPTSSRRSSALRSRLRCASSTSLIAACAGCRGSASAKAGSRSSASASPPLTSDGR